MFSFKCQNETAKITLQNTIVTTRRVKTIARNTLRYSQDNLGHCESFIKEMGKRIHVFISNTWRADYQCDRDRYATWTITRYAINAEEQKSVFKLMNKDYHSQIAKYSELSWFRSIAKQLKVAEQQNDAHSVRKLKRGVEHPLVIKGLICSVRTGQEQAHDEKWNSNSIKALLNCTWELKASTAFYTSAVRQKCITNRVLDKRGRLGRRNTFVQESSAIRDHCDPRARRSRNCKLY